MKNIIFKSTIALILTLFIALNLQAQGWIRYYNENTAVSNPSMVITPDDGFLLAGKYNNSSVILIKTDAEGIEEWTEVYDFQTTYLNPQVKLIQNLDGNFTIFTRMNGTPGNAITRMVKITPLGDILAEQLLERNYDVIVLSDDGNYLAITDDEIFKFDTNGNELWSILSNFTLSTIITTSDGGFLVTASDWDWDDEKALITKFDANNNEEWVATTSNMVLIFGITETQDGGFAYTGILVTAEGDFLYEKIDSQGNIVWTDSFGDTSQFINELGWEVIEGADGNLFFLGQRDSPFGNIILKVTSDGDLVWSTFLNHPPLNIFSGIIETTDGSIALHGRTYDDLLDKMVLAKLDSNGVLFSNILQGNLFHDLNGNCTLDTFENGFQNWLIEADGIQDFFAIPNANGEYAMLLDTGNYDIRVYTPNNYWTTCQDSFPVEFTTFFDTLSLDLPLIAAVDCPRLEVELSSSLFRLCPQSNRIFVDYCNNGTIESQNAYVEVTLDANMLVDSFSLQPTNIDNNVYSFPIEDLSPFDCGEFIIYFQLTCDVVQIGQTLCAEAHTFPDSLCLTPNWLGPIISLDGSCEPDSVTFIIENEGGNMSAPQQYIIIEDNIILMQEPFQLLNGETETIKIPIENDATYFMLAEQADGIPTGNNYATYVVENCVELPLNNIFNQFAFADNEPYLDELCREVVASFDPNDKQGFPTGFGPDHRIEANTDLDYLIRFQNTGTDTAFKVVLRDELSQFLDITTLHPGASSHPYTLDIVNGRTLKFTFDNILLPDSTTNEAASQGWVQFHIDQMPDNPIGTLIENQAAIYFDGNAPILTNTTKHLIGEDFIQIIDNATQVFRPNVELKVYPNPAQEYAIFEIKNMDDANLTFKLFNSAGQLQRVDNFIENAYYFYRNGLTEGLYFYQIESEGVLVVTGKLVLQ